MSKQTQQKTRTHTVLFIFSLFLILILSSSVSGYRLNASDINSIYINTTQSCNIPINQSQNIKHLFDRNYTTNQACQTINNASIDQKITIVFNKNFGQIQNISFLSENFLGVMWLNYSSFKFGNQQFPVYPPYTTSSNVLPPKQNVFFDGSLFPVTALYNTLIIDLNVDATSNGSVGNPFGWFLNHHEIELYIGEELNAYPVINNYGCELINYTSMSNDYKCFINATDEENDTIYYAFDCGEFQDVSYKNILRPQINTSHVNFNATDSPYIAVGSIDRFFNKNANCDFKQQRIPNLDNGFGFNINHSTCDVDNHSNAESELSLGVYMVDMGNGNYFDSFISHSSEVYLMDGGNIIIDYKESATINPLSSELIINITKVSDYYIIQSSTNNYTSGYSQIANITGTYIRVMVDFYYDTNYYTLSVFVYNKSTVDNIVPFDTGILVYNSPLLTLGAGVFGDFNTIVKYYSYSDTNNQYLLKSYATPLSKPTFVYENYKYCSYNVFGEKPIFFYASDSAHGSDFSNYKYFILSVTDNKVLKDLKIIDSLLGVHTNEFRNAWTWGLFILFIGLLFLAYKRSGDITSGEIVGILFIIILISIPLMYFHLVHRWFIIIDALLVAFGIAKFFSWNGGGE